jgi:antitoxin ParD1/3/4
MGLQLRRETEKQIEERIQSGNFASADDLIIAGLKLLDERELATREGLNEVRRKIAVGLQQLDRGEGMDGDAVFAELLSQLDDSDAT